MNKIAIIDIDGVLSDYPNNVFFKFIKDKKNHIFRNKEEIVNKYGRFEYDRLKNEFRRSGLKLKYKVKENSKESIDLLRAKGYFISIITSRPLLIENIYTTRTWLNENKINYDQLFFVRDKASAFLETSNYDQVIIIDDEYKGLIDYLGFENIQLYKFGFGNEFYSNIKVVKNWLEIMKDVIKEKIDVISDKSTN